MDEMKFEYDEIGDVLDVYFDKKRPAWAIELTPNIVVSIDRESRRVVMLTLMDYSEMVRPTSWGARSFPITGLADMPQDERDLVLDLLTSHPLTHLLDISTVENLPDSPFAVAHVKHQSPILQHLVLQPA